MYEITFAPLSIANYVLPKLKTCKLGEVQGRLVEQPITPLTTAQRK